MASDDSRQDETGMLSEDNYDRNTRENMTDTTDTQTDDSVL